MPSRRKRNKYTFGLYVHCTYYIFLYIPSLLLPHPLSLRVFISINRSLSHTHAHAHAHTISLSRCIFIFILYIDTKLSPPVNKYRQQWPPPKGGSFSYFNASSWSYPPSTLRHTTVPVYDFPLCTLRVYGPVQGFKTIFTQQCAFFLSFFIFIFFFTCFCTNFSRAMYTSFLYFHTLRLRLPRSTFHTIANQIIQSFVCVWFSTFAKLIPLGVCLYPTEGCMYRTLGFTVHRSRGSCKS